MKLVGLVFEKTERVTDVSFTLDDGTGRIDCHRWYALGVLYYFIVVLMLDECYYYAVMSTFQ